jgi:hypothetical protein
MTEQCSHSRRRDSRLAHRRRPDPAPQGASPSRLSLPLSATPAPPRSPASSASASASLPSPGSPKTDRRPHPKVTQAGIAMIQRHAQRRGKTPVLQARRGTGGAARSSSRFLIPNQEPTKGNGLVPNTAHILLHLGRRQGRMVEFQRWWMRQLVSKRLAGSLPHPAPNTN